MQTVFKDGLNLTVMRFINRYLLLSLISLLLAQAASAQQATPMSPSVVLVLKLVSATHVKPTTGIVVSDNGLVLVPTDFVSTDGEIVVLDGGTDILSHGRPAKVINISEPGGLAVLSVEGLKRPGFILSASNVSAESKVHLQAFPPAEYIAKGAQPLWLPIEILQNEAHSQVSVSPETPLPYVSGPIIDNCGHLVGLSLTRGPHSLEPGKSPVVIFRNELVSVLDSIQVSLPEGRCTPPVQRTEPPTNEQEKSSFAITDPQEPVLEGSETEAVTAEPVATETREVSGTDSPLETSQGAAVNPGNSVNGKANDRPSNWRDIPFWVPLLGIIILGVLIWKGIFFFRLSKHAPAETDPAHTGSINQSASEEPDTAQLKPATDPSSPGLRSAPLDETEIPDMNALPSGCNGIVLVEGQLDADTPFKRLCAVNTKQIDLVIGRGETDISIEHPAISRAHVRLQCDAQSMTLSDLGSSNGTFIRGIPCLPGEIMFLETDDEIFLGDVGFRISVIGKEMEPS
jgi:hypothetical protein